MKMLRKPVEAIVLFDLEGNPVPVRFRYLDDSSELITVKVDRVIKRELDKFAGNRMLKFTCQTRIGNQIKPFELRFEIDTSKWYLYKI
ncbi:MAG TPA: hypothetical protein PKW47_10920 [Bacillota bacterium]|nr:hypothetical protein [Bacillota bacterium]HNT03691.1 hypothetical protein [Bacillota bacterium]HQA66363.1 hypothetical protein [Bacillota bacterium]